MNITNLTFWRKKYFTGSFLKISTTIGKWTHTKFETRGLHVHVSDKENF
jgi:hypothetical protein